MNDQMFASMADQMRPDEDVLARLLAQLDAEDVAEPAESTAQPPADPVEVRPARRRVPPARWWIGIAASLAAVALMLQAVGGWPLHKRSVGSQTTESAPVGVLDYATLYRAAVEAAARSARGMTAAGAAEDGSIKAGAPVPAPQTGSSWQTNAQVVGIDEGDLVKSDGRTIFAAAGTKVAIAAADGSRTRQLSVIDTSVGEAAKPVSSSYALQGNVVELELWGTTLVAFVSEYQPRKSALPTSVPAPGPATSWIPFDAALTKALFYDVSDPSAPKYLTSLGQSGGLVTTRLTDGVLYVVTDYTLADSKSLDPDDPSTFVPVLTEGTKAVPTSPADTGVLPEPSGPTYTVVSSIDLAGRKRVDTQSVLGGTGTVYMSTANLYLAATDWDPSAKELARAGAKDLKQGALTQLARIGIEAGRLSLAAQGVIPGTVLNQFALDEYQGDLRVVTSIEGQARKGGGWVQRAGLFVLGANLKVVGSISSLVSGEQVQSVRFADAVGYVVTFRQMDPLFAVDLSVPAKPRVLSALKIPGFSTYLHPWSDGELLGLGRDATSRGEDRGLKLSMFDVTDPLNVSETTTLRVAGDDAEALSDHRAVLVDPADGLIGFAVTDWGKNKAKLSYQTFRYEQGTGFSLVKKISLAVPSTEDVPRVRGLLVEGILYLASSNGVSAYTTDTYDRLAHVTFKG